MRKILSQAFLCLILFSANAQETKIRFFGQPNATYSNSSTQYSNPLFPNTHNSSTNFNSGNFVMFITSQLTDRISVLGEAYSYYDNTNKQFHFEVSRLFLRYYYKDYLSFRIGRMYTPIGYWNNQYNLGLVLQPTITRPFQIRLSDEGGLLQTRDIGVQVEGDNIGPLRFSYRLFAANGISYYGSNDKKDNSIAVTANIGIEPVEGFKLILSGMADRIRKGQPNNGGTLQKDNGQLYLLNASVVYMNPEKKFEFVSEFYEQISAFDSIGTGRSVGVFAYAGYKVTNKLIPYGLFNYSAAGNGNQPDYYFIGNKVHVSELVLGLRYKFNANVVAKLEYSYQALTLENYSITVPTGLPAPYPATTTLQTDFTTYTHTPRFQLAFAF